jgi:hypothetical protein
MKSILARRRRSAGRKPPKRKIVAEGFSLKRKMVKRLSKAGMKS